MVVLITGASVGIGQACAELFMKQGYKVYGTTRNISKIPEEKLFIEDKNSKGFIKMIALDVTDDEQAKSTVLDIIKAEGKIDILVNNAGIGVAGAIEDTSVDEAKWQLETNFFGLLRMVNIVLPYMREKRSGKIINISSVMGLISLPYQAMYCAAKYAVESLTEAIRMECKAFGITACAVEPGDTKTDFTNSRRISANSNENSPYFTCFNRSVKKMEHDEQNGVPPINVAKVVLKMAEKKNPPIRSIVGFDYKLFVFLKRILPSRLVEYIVGKMYG